MTSIKDKIFKTGVKPINHGFIMSGLQRHVIIESDHIVMPGDFIIISDNDGFLSDLYRVVTFAEVITNSLREGEVRKEVCSLRKLELHEYERLLNIISLMSK